MFYDINEAVKTCKPTGQTIKNQGSRERTAAASKRCDLQMAAATAATSTTAATAATASATTAATSTAAAASTSTTDRWTRGT